MGRDGRIDHGSWGYNRKSKIQNPKSPYDWLVLTSVNGVAAFWEQLQSAGLDSRCLATVKIAAIGPATTAALNRQSIAPHLVPEVYTAEGVLAAFDLIGPVTNQSFLLARADIARKALAEGLIEGLRLGHSASDVKVGEHPEVHGFLP